MTRQHSSFLLRCWTRNGWVERIEAAHIQSGKKIVARSVAEAVDWVCASSSDASADHAAAVNEATYGENHDNI
jgi:hypothetical protein